MRLKDISRYLRKPKLFADSTSPFWDDPHISEEMLAAHLDPKQDAASRKHITIDKSVDWITRKSGLGKGDKVLDLGCGPGLYCARFAQKGLKVTGIDYSKRSIQYATEYTKQNRLDIDYISGDYTTIDYPQDFDLIVLIYCDFGVLSDQDKDLILRKIHRSLKPGGFFVFDVNTPCHHDSIAESKSWSFQKNGFWRAIPYLLLSEVFKYPKSNVLLDQYVVIDDDSCIDVYRIWDRAYSIKSMSQLLAKNNFSDLEFYADLTGNEYREDSKTMGIIVRK